MWTSAKLPAICREQGFSVKGQKILNARHYGPKHAWLLGWFCSGDGCLWSKILGWPSLSIQIDWQFAWMLVQRTVYWKHDWSFAWIGVTELFKEMSTESVTLVICMDWHQRTVQRNVYWKRDSLVICMDWRHRTVCWMQLISFCTHFPLSWRVALNASWAFSLCAEGLLWEAVMSRAGLFNKTMFLWVLVLFLLILFFKKNC